MLCFILVVCTKDDVKDFDVVLAAILALKFTMLFVFLSVSNIFQCFAMSVCNVTMGEAT